MFCVYLCFECKIRYNIFIHLLLWESESFPIQGSIDLDNILDKKLKGSDFYPAISGTFLSVSKVNHVNSFCKFCYVGSLNIHV